jgi:hypothetical protein
MAQSIEVLLKLKADLDDGLGNAIKGLRSIDVEAKRTATSSTASLKTLGGGFDQTSSSAGRLADAVGRTATTMARSASAFGLPVEALRALDDAADIAELGLNNLTKSSAGFNAASLGVAGAGLAIGTMIGGWLRTFPAVSAAADKMAATLRYAFTGFDTTEATHGLKAFSAAAGAGHAAALEKQVASMKAQGATVEQIAKLYGKSITPEMAKQLGIGQEQVKVIAKQKSLLESQADARREYLDVAGQLKKAEEQIALELERQLRLKELMAGPDSSQIKRIDILKNNPTPFGDALAGGSTSNTSAGPLDFTDASRIKGIVGDVAELGEKFGEAAREGAKLKGLLGGLGEFASMFGQDAGAAAQKIGNMNDSWARGTEELHRLEKGTDKAATAQSKLERNVGLAAAAGDLLGGAMEGSKNKVVSMAGSALKGAAAGAKMGMAFGPWGAAIGAVGGALVSVVSKLGIFGNKAIMETNKVRDAFFAQQGGFEAFSKTMSKVSKDDWAKKIFDAKSVEEFNKLVKESQDLLAMQGKAQELLNAAVEKYGFTIEELGPKFAQQKLDEQAGGLLQDYQLLIAAGVDYNAIISRMGPAFQDYVNAAASAGGTIPEAMRPVMQAMLDAGTLIHANGEAFTQAELDGLSFTQTMSEQFKTLVDSIADLVAALTGIPRDINVNTNYTETGPRPGGGGGGGQQQQSEFARGGVVLPFRRAAAGMVVNGPTRVLMGEGGKAELAAPVEDMLKVMTQTAMASAGSQPIVIKVVLDGRVIDQHVVQANRSGRIPAQRR